jgi:two-component system copper resistance phosphate regulon response regulator CusR
MYLLVVEDNIRISTSLNNGLRELGHSVIIAKNGVEALTTFRNKQPDLMILDLGLPDMDGLDVLNQMNTEGRNFPVIILTARDSIDEKVTGLDAGADDYLVKPFAFPELAARIRALERRGTKDSQSTITIADLVIDPLRRTVHRGDASIDLTPREFDILLFLAIRAGETVTREMIASEVLGIATHLVAYDNIIDVHISNLRKKIDFAAAVKLLHTIRGVGYRLEQIK